MPCRSGSAITGTSTELKLINWTLPSGTGKASITADASMQSENAFRTFFHKLVMVMLLRTRLLPIPCQGSALFTAIQLSAGT